MTTLSGVAQKSRDHRHILAILAVTSLTAACQDQSQITRYTVPREAARSTAPAPEAAPARTQKAPIPAGRPERMLTGLVPHADNTWFFKLTGPEPLISDLAEPFQRLIASIRFEPAADTPTWDAPPEWRRLPAAGMRYATLEIDTAEGPLELTVTPLKTSPGDYQDYVLANVNRWRTQLSLDPIDKSVLTPTSAIQEVPLATGEVAVVVDLKGTSPATDAAASMGAMPRPPLDRSRTASAPATTDSSSPLHYHAPQEWSVLPASGMRKAAFGITNDSGSAEVTIIALAAGSGDLLSNVNRWRQQVQLGPVTPDALAAELKPISLLGVQGHLVELVSPPDAQRSQAILGAIGTHENQDWFIKMIGDTRLVQNERDRFQAFVESITFQDSHGAGDGH